METVKCEPDVLVCPKAVWADKELEKLRIAYTNAISALAYIRARYGDLPGIDWKRLDEIYGSNK